MTLPDQTQPQPMSAPDPILAELWEVKRQLNEGAGYRVAERARMAHEAALQIEARWHDESNTSTRNPSGGFAVRQSAFFRD